MYLYKCSCGSESLIASPGAMRCDCGGTPELVSGKHHPVLCGDLKKDLQSLAKLVYEASEMHGGRYITANRIPDSTASAWASEDSGFAKTETYPNESTVYIAPCPFCGSQTAPKAFTKSEIEEIDSTPSHEPEYWQVCCSARHGGCGAGGGFQPTKEKAISAWNGRAGK